MIQSFSKFTTTLLLTLFLLPPAIASEFVRVQLDYAGTIKNMDIELYRDSAPLTVENFLDYVNRADYNDSFINRSVPGFILQSGGYTFKPTNPLIDPIGPVGTGTGLDTVPDGPLSPVLNEFSISNTRGTIAMAKIPDLPDSATNEWFINLADNQNTLDGQNGGFTVFGKIIDNGMTIADEIATYPKNSNLGGLLGGAFTDTPVVGSGASTASDILQNNLVMIRDISTITRPVISTVPARANFGLDIAGDSVSELITITITNNGNGIMDIGAINAADLAAPFSITNDNCSDTSLLPLSTSATANCTIDLVFSADTAIAFSDSITLPYTNQLDGEAYFLSYNLVGTGAPQSTPVTVMSTTVLIFPETVINSSTTRLLGIYNNGGGPLTITGRSLTNEFVTDNNYSILSGCDAGTVLVFEASCIMTVQFSPTTIDAGAAFTNKYATINITTDDPDTANASIDTTVVGESSKPIIGFTYQLDFIAQVNSEALGFMGINNIGTGHLILSDISFTGPDAAYFSQINDCPGTRNDPDAADRVVTAGKSCAVLIFYRPTAAGSHSTTLNISSNDPDSPTVQFNLTGGTDIATISVAGNPYVGNAQLNGAAITRDIIITNTGVAPLDILSITGLPLNNFSETNNCLTFGYVVKSGSSCTIRVTFDPVAMGVANANLLIESNDLTTPIITINLEALVDIDTDGIPASVELGSPNNGDGNLDGTTDDTQNNVASYQLPDQKYVTLVSEDSKLLQEPTTIENLRVTYDYAAETISDTENLDFGIQKFIINTPTGDGVRLGIYLPTGSNPGNYYKYGPTLDNDTPHWYEFNYDPITLTGAEFVGNTNIQTSIGTIQRNLVILHFVDGVRGDDDLTFNGKIIQGKGGITTNSQSNSDSGGSVSILLLMPMLLISLMRIKYHKTKS